MFFAPSNASSDAIAGFVEPLLRRLRRRERLAVHPGTVKAARAALAGGKHVAGGGDAADAGVLALAGGDPADPVAAGDGGDVVPDRLGFRSGGQGLAKLGR